MTPDAAEAAATRRTGLAWGLAAYGAWGLFPFYFRPLRGVDPLELLAHRIVWSFLLLAALVAASPARRAALVGALGRPRLRYGLVASALLIATNWFTYTVAVTTGRVLEASFGYFLNPLLSVALGVLVLGERFTLGLRIGVGFAVLGCALAGAGQQLSLAIPLALASSFGLYGLLRNRLSVDPVTGLLVETGVVVGPAAVVLVWHAHAGTGAFSTGNPARDALLLLAGPVTTAPLLAFAAAARRLPLSTVGLLQYLTPSMLFVLATTAFGEPMDLHRLAAFACIWAGLGVGMWFNWRGRRAPDGAAGPPAR